MDRLDGSLHEQLEVLDTAKSSNNVRKWTLQIVVMIGSVFSHADNSNAQQAPIPAPPAPAPAEPQPAPDAPAEVPPEPVAERITQPNQICVLHHRFLEKWKSKDPILEQQYSSVNEWKDREESLQKILQTMLENMDTQEWSARQDASRKTFEEISTFLEQCNPLPGYLSDFLSQYRRPETLKKIIPEQQVRLRNLENEIWLQRCTLPSRIPSFEKIPAHDLLNFLEETFSIRISFEDPSDISMLKDIYLTVSPKENSFGNVMKQLCEHANLMLEQKASGMYVLRSRLKGETLHVNGSYLAAIQKSDSQDAFDIQLIHDPSGALISLIDVNTTHSPHLPIEVRIPGNRIPKWESTCGNTSYKDILEADSVRSASMDTSPEVAIRVVRAFAPQLERLPIDSKDPRKLSTQSYQPFTMVNLNDSPTIGIATKVYAWLEWSETSAATDVWTYRLVDAAKFQIHFANGKTEHVIPDEMRINRRSLDVRVQYKQGLTPTAMSVSGFSGLQEDCVRIPLPSGYSKHSDEK